MANKWTPRCAGPRRRLSELLLFGVATEESENELSEPADIFAATLGGFVIKSISLRTATVVGETGQMNIVWLGPSWNFRQTSAKLPRFVPRFTHPRSISQLRR